MPFQTYTHPRTGKSVRTRSGVSAVEAACAVYEAGGSVAEAGQAAAVSGPCAHRWMTELGIVRDNEWAQRLVRGTVDLPEEAARLYGLGLSVREIADLQDVAHATVIRALERAGVDRLDKSAGQLRSRRSRESRRKAVAACRIVAAGHSYAEAGRQVGVSGAMARHYWHGRYNPYRQADLG